MVWQGDSIDLYRSVVTPFLEHCLSQKRKFVYLRFATHPPLIDENLESPYLVRKDLDPSLGFDSFTREIHKIIAQEGRGIAYVLDSLSDLLAVWATDLMVGNFFSLTCPFLFEMDTVAYFLLLRGKHSYSCVARIREVTQLLLDVHGDQVPQYLQALKVEDRYSPRMFLPHAFHQEGKEPYTDCLLKPITESSHASALIQQLGVFLPQGQFREERNLDFWNRLFSKARENPQDPQWLEKIAPLLLGRDQKILDLALRYMALEDFLKIEDRMIGTGFIGGKAVGLVLSRAILEKICSIEVVQHLENHDSFYVGSDVFYTFLVRNLLWKEWILQKEEDQDWTQAAHLREKIKEGDFSSQEKESFLQVLEYFGQSPIIIRSSSLLEDGYGNAFAGKYESLFLPNQGTPSQRLDALLKAAKRIYSSLLSEEALEYRRHRGLKEKEEQMSLLIMRVSGSLKGNFFHPDLGGVGFSRNPYPWKKGMNPRKGLLRLVYGMGTRAVDRIEGDYARIMSLEDPRMIPWGKENEKKKYTQKKMDTINIQTNALEVWSISQWSYENESSSLKYFGKIDREMQREFQKRGYQEVPWILDFQELSKNQKEIHLLESVLDTLDQAYGAPVDIEFTLNYHQNNFLLNILQCRPLPTYGPVGKISNQNRMKNVQKDILVQTPHFLCPPDPRELTLWIRLKPSAYLGMTESQRHMASRDLGKVLKKLKLEGEKVFLSGPGRWGTNTPGLGMPVGFQEIAWISVLAEERLEREGWSPELSYGTHFFQDLVETGIAYLTLEDSYEVDLKLKDCFQKKVFHPSTGIELPYLEAYPLKEGRLWIDWDHPMAMVLCELP